MGKSGVLPAPRIVPEAHRGHPRVIEAGHPRARARHRAFPDRPGAVQPLLRSTLARLLPVGWGWGPRGLHTQDTACHHAKPWVYAEAQRRERGGRKEAESMREGLRAMRGRDGWPSVPAQASEAAGSRVRALTFPQRLVTSHPPPPQDAAGPPGPLCASSAARLRLAGSPLRQHPRRAKSPEPSGIVVALTRSPEAPSARPCP